MSLWRAPRCLALAAMLVLALADAAASHPLAPALLDLREDAAGGVDVLWKRSTLSRPSGRLHPLLPEACPSRSDPRADREGVAVLERWRVDCGPQGLVGRSIGIAADGPIDVDVLVRIELSDGRTIQRVLRRAETSMIVPAKASKGRVLLDYGRIGFDHILAGADHLLFVLGLYLLCTTTRALVKTITAFTVGHSVTLSLAALGMTDLPSGPIEVLIAASVLVLAVELARDEPDDGTWMRRHPWPMSLGFGLLHGMGFASALREVGLPSGEIPMALLSFNLGIELGQLVFVGALLALAPMVRRLPFPAPTRAAVYVMGSLAAFWVFDRSAAVF
jgi:hydrogenase/urease accessory protein HupE